MEELHHAAAHLQQLWDDGQHFWVADVDGIVPVGLFLVADVSQMEDGREQGEDPGERDQHLSGLLVMETLGQDLLDSWKTSLNLENQGCKMCICFSNQCETMMWNYRHDWKRKFDFLAAPFSFPAQRWMSRWTAPSSLCYPGSLDEPRFTVQTWMETKLEPKTTSETTGSQ